jgi:alpha/beta superfamily hydrolase
MDNNVVRGLCAGLARRGVAVLGFNYRGVGGSEGTPPDVTASLAEFWATSRTAEEAHYASDFRAAAARLPGLVGANLPRALIGYSFGCSILTAASSGPDCPMVLVAPTIGQHDYAAFAEVTNPILVIAPDGDFAADVNVVTRWFATLRGPKRLVRGEWDTHFFRGQEGQLAETVFAFLSERWGVGA